MRRRDDEDLALDRIDRLPSATRGDINLPSTRASADGNDPAPQSVDELRTDLAQLDALADQVRASSEARREAQRIVDEASARITELERRPRGILRCGTSDPARPAFERERLKAAEHQIVETAERERELAGSLSARGTPQLEHEAPRKGAAAIETELAILRQRGRHGALESSIEPYLTVALGPLPEQPRARRTWEQAAHRIEADRFEHGISDPTALWDPHPPASPCEHTGSEHSETSTELNERSARRSPASTTSFRHSVATAAATREQARGISSRRCLFAADAGASPRRLETLVARPKRACGGRPWRRSRFARRKGRTPPHPPPLGSRRSFGCCAGGRARAVARPKELPSRECGVG
jgi:hypothetical protein